MLNDLVVAWDRINRARNEPKLIREKFHSIKKKKSHDVKLTHLRKFGDFGMCGLWKGCCSMETRVSAMKSDDSRRNLIILNGVTLSHQMHIIFCMSSLRFFFASKWLDKRATGETKQQSWHMSSSCRPSTLLQYLSYTTPRLAFSIARWKEEKLAFGTEQRKKVYSPFAKTLGTANAKTLRRKPSK